MQDIKEVYTVNEANKLLKDGYILFNTHFVGNEVICYILVL